LSHQEYYKKIRALSFLLLAASLIIFTASAALNGTETKISFNSIQDEINPPAVYENRIAWVEVLENFPPGSLSKYVYAYDLETGDEYRVLPDLFPDVIWQTAPSISEDTIVWLNDKLDGNFRIVAYDLITRTLKDEVTAVPEDYYSDPSLNVFPRVYGNEIVWQDYTGFNWDVYSYTIGAGTKTPTPLIADGTYDEKNPVIFGDYVVYENWSAGNADIYLYFRSNATAVQISSSPNDDILPSVYENIIVWEGTSAGHQVINRCDILTGELSQITPTGANFDQKNPEMYGNSVVVEDYRQSTAYPDIYLYDLITGEERWLTPASDGLKRNPAIFGDRIVWEDHRADYACGGVCNAYDIYLLTRGTADTCPVADFTLVNPYGANPLDVSFSDTSVAGTSAIVHRVWNFSDGSPWKNNPALTTTHQFTADGSFPVKLTVGNLKCRNMSVDLCQHSVFVNHAPVADFTLSPEYGFAPLPVSFTDTSCGGPTSWSWDFGDGHTSLLQNPSNTYVTSATTYTTKLTATNAHGSDSVQKTLRTFLGSQSTAFTPVTGITVDNRYGGSFLAFNGTELNSFIPPVPVTTIHVRPPSTYFWKNITFLASDGIGFKKSAGNDTYFANVSRIYLKTNDTVANAVGTVPPIGTGWGVNYQINTTTYPSPASVKTEIREGALTGDRDSFDTLARNSQPTGTTLRDIAYTAQFTKTNIINEGTGIINMSVAQSWVQGSASTIDEGRSYTYILGYGYDSEGNKRGAILTTQYRFSSGGLDYFEAEIPENLAYLSTFALSKLSGSGNPLQLITLTVASHIIPSPSGSDDDNGPGPAAGTGKAAAIEPAPNANPPPALLAPPDPGKTEKIYANAEGVITQATLLESTDKYAQVSIGLGVVAKDATGAPLSSVTLTEIPAESLPSIPSSTTYTFAGMAYDLGPDGAHFSPPITLSFTYTEARWGADYTVRVFDPESGSWQDLPTTRDASTGMITAQISDFCCFALFAKPVVTATPAPKPVKTVQMLAPPETPAPPPGTALNIFTGMIAWVAGLVIKNVYILVIAVVLGIAYFFRKRKYPGQGR
jgi:beta propeller repeat protein